MEWISVSDRLPDYSARKRGLPTIPLEERLKANMVINVITGCWEWQGSKRNGYGRITIGSRKQACVFAEGMRSDETREDN